MANCLYTSKESAMQEADRKKLEARRLKIDQQIQEYELDEERRKTENRTPSPQHAYTRTEEDWTFFSVS